MLKLKSKPEVLDKYSVVGFEVHQAIGEISSLVLYLHARSASEAPVFADHADLQSALGEETVCECQGWRFAGIIDRIEYESDTRFSRVVIRDLLSRLARSFSSRVFVNKSIEDIISEILPSEMDMVCLGDISKKKISMAIQYQESAISFIDRLLRRHGGQFWCHGKRLFIGNEPSSEVTVVRLERDILSFSFGVSLGLESATIKSIEYSRGEQLNTSESRSKKISEGELQKIAQSKGENISETAEFHLVSEDGVTNDDSGLGESFLGRNSSRRFSFNGSSLVPVPIGTKVEIECLGADGSDKREVATVCSLTANNPADSSDGDVRWEIEAVSPQSLSILRGDLPPSKSLVSSAIVKKTNEATNRATVIFPWDKSGEETPFLRVLTQSWGQDHMSYFPPREGDTVLVTWGQWDMDPVIIGSLASGVQVATPSDVFHFQTVHGHRVSIDEKKIGILNEAGSSGTNIEINPDSVVLTTSEGESVEIGPNKLAMKHPGGSSIVVESSKVTIVSSGEIEISNESGASIKLSGPSVTLNGGALEVI